MSNATLIIGESGTGKSSSIRKLDPTKTFIINVLGKPLPFRSGRHHYKKVSKDLEGNIIGNYFSSDNCQKILNCIDTIDSKMGEISTIIIDDWQYIMCNEYMRRATENGFSKFTEIGKNAWSIIKALIDCRPDLDVFVLSHSDTNEGKSRCKTIGKLLDDKISVEGMFTTVLHSLIVDGDYKFLTQNDGFHLAKSPMGMFNDKYLDNDLLIIKNQMEDYYSFDEDIDMLDSNEEKI
jgi:hypothetical protein